MRVLLPPLHISCNTDINIHATTAWLMAHRESHTCWKYLSQLMYSLSWESCSLLVLMYCQRAWMMQERVWVWMPSRRARRGSSLNWGGCGNDVIILQHFFFFFLKPPTSEPLQQTLLSYSPPRPDLKTDVRFDNGVLNALPHVSVDWWLSEMWGLQVVTTTAGSMAWIRHRVVTEEGLFLDRVVNCLVPLPHLVVQHQQQSAAHAHVSRPFHLEAVSLLGGGRAVPLKQQTSTHWLHTPNWRVYSGWMIILLVSHFNFYLFHTF